MNQVVSNGLASAPAIKQYVKAAEACGVDIQPLLAEAGIDPKMLEDNNRHLPNACMERLLALLIPASKDPCFGLHAASFVEPASFSVLGYISMNCSTPRMITVRCCLISPPVVFEFAKAYSMKCYLRPTASYWKCYWPMPPNYWPG